MGQENQEINIGEIFIDNINFDLYGKYHVVEVVDLSYKEMWGLKGKEIVTIVKYKKLANIVKQHLIFLKIISNQLQILGMKN